MKTQFALNTRHNIDVNLNAQTGLCDVVVTDTQSGETLTKSLSLMVYNDMVEWFQDQECNNYAVSVADMKFGA